MQSTTQKTNSAPSQSLNSKLSKLFGLLAVPTVLSSEPSHAASTHATSAVPTNRAPEKHLTLQPARNQTVPYVSDIKGLTPPKSPSAKTNLAASRVAPANTAETSTIKQVLNGSKEAITPSNLSKKISEDGVVTLLTAGFGAAIGYLSALWKQRREKETLAKKLDLSLAEVHMLQADPDGSIFSKRVRGGCLVGDFHLRSSWRDMIVEATKLTSADSPILKLDPQYSAPLMFHLRNQLRERFDNLFWGTLFKRQPFIEKRFVVAVTHEQSESADSNVKAGMGQHIQILLLDYSVARRLLDNHAVGEAFNPNCLKSHQGTKLPEPHRSARAASINQAIEVFARHRSELLEHLPALATDKERSLNSISELITMVDLPESMPLGEYRSFIKKQLNLLEDHTSEEAGQARDFFSIQPNKELRKVLNAKEMRRVSQILEQHPRSRQGHSLLDQLL